MSLEIFFFTPCTSSSSSLLFDFGHIFYVSVGQRCSFSYLHCVLSFSYLSSLLLEDRSSSINMMQDVYICEVDSRFNYRRIPRMFSRRYYDIISERVLLIDPFDNGIEVRVEKKSGRLHFTDGWGQIRGFYNLRDGGWIQLRYLNRSQIRIDVQDQDINEIIYSLPPRILKLGVASDLIPVPDDGEDNDSVYNSPERLMFGTASKIGESSVGRRESIGETEKHRWFYAEYDILSAHGKMGRMFCSDFYYLVPNHVILCDPYGNELDVRVKRVNKKRRLYFGDGWHQIATFYNLQRGGWVKFYYLSRSKFMITVYDRNMSEVDYRHAWERNNSVGNPGIEPANDNGLLGEDGVDENGDNVDVLENDDNGVLLDEGDNFDYSLQKTLKLYEVNSSKLFLNAAFSSVALSTKPSRCVLVGESGESYTARLIWVERSKNECYIGHGWLNFVRQHGLEAGAVIKFGVKVNEPETIYVSVVYSVC